MVILWGSTQALRQIIDAASTRSPQLVCMAVGYVGELFLECIECGVPLSPRFRISKFPAGCVIRNARLKSTFGSESRRNLDKPKFTALSINTERKLCITPFIHLSACFCVIKKLGFKNKNAHNINTHKTFTLCANKSGFGLTVLVTTIEASMSLFQQLNCCHPERDVVRTSKL